MHYPTVPHSPKLFFIMPTDSLPTSDLSFCPQSKPPFFEEWTSSASIRRMIFIPLCCSCKIKFCFENELCKLFIFLLDPASTLAYLLVKSNHIIPLWKSFKTLSSIKIHIKMNKIHWRNQMFVLSNVVLQFVCPCSHLNWWGGKNLKHGQG